MVVVFKVEQSADTSLFDNVRQAMANFFPAAAMADLAAMIDATVFVTSESLRKSLLFELLATVSLQHVATIGTFCCGGSLNPFFLCLRIKSGNNSSMDLFEHQKLKRMKFSM